MFYCNFYVILFNSVYKLYFNIKFESFYESLEYKKIVEKT